MCFMCFVRHWCFCKHPCSTRCRTRVETSRSTWWPLVALKKFVGKDRFWTRAPRHRNPLGTYRIGGAFTWLHLCFVFFLLYPEIVFLGEDSQIHSFQSWNHHLKTVSCCKLSSWHMSFVGCASCPYWCHYPIDELLCRRIKVYAYFHGNLRGPPQCHPPQGLICWGGPLDCHDIWEANI